MLNIEREIDKLVDVMQYSDNCSAFLKLTGEQCNKILCNECKQILKEWLLSEYKKPVVDWTKIKKDTKICVWNGNLTAIKFHRYFAGIKDNKILTYPKGTTSWSYFDNLEVWDNAELVEE